MNIKNIETTVETINLRDVELLGNLVRKQNRFYEEKEQVLRVVRNNIVLDGIELNPHHGDYAERLAGFYERNKIITPLQKNVATRVNQETGKTSAMNYLNTRVKFPKQIGHVHYFEKR